MDNTQEPNLVGDPTNLPDAKQPNSTTDLPTPLSQRDPDFETFAKNGYIVVQVEYPATATGPGYTKQAFVWLSDLAKYYAPPPPPDVYNPPSNNEAG